MVTYDFADAALVLVGHGSTVNARSAAPVLEQAEALRHRGIFAEVQACLWKEGPGIAAVVGMLKTPRLFVVPLFVSEGYFTQEVIPNALGLPQPGGAGSARVGRRGGQTLYYCPPIGTHPSMTELLLARARDVVQKHPFPHAPKAEELALVVVGHGTDRSAESRRAVERQVSLIRARATYGEVHAVFLEEEPRVGAAYELTQAKNLVVAPFFISDGLHVDEDIPVLLGEAEAAVRERLRRGLPTWRNPTERRGKRVWYAGGLGSEPAIAAVILELVKETQLIDPSGALGQRA